MRSGLQFFQSSRDWERNELSHGEVECWPVSSQNETGQCFFVLFQLLILHQFLWSIPTIIFLLGPSTAPYRGSRFLHLDVKGHPIRSVYLKECR
jgi:hypothetical protein